MIVFAVDNGQADDGVIESFRAAEMGQGLFAHQFRLGVVTHLRSQRALHLFREILAGGQHGGGTEKDVRDAQGRRGPGQIDGAEVVDVKGDFRVAVDPGDCRIDNEVRPVIGKKASDVGGIAETQLLAVGGQNVATPFLFERVNKGAAHQAGTANDEAGSASEKVFGCCHEKPAAGEEDGQSMMQMGHTHSILQQELSVFQKKDA